MLIEKKIFIRVLVLLLSVMTILALPLKGEAFWFDSDAPLLKINDAKFDEADYRDWWREWRDPESRVHEDMTIFIEWQLEVYEAQSMELFENRSYKRKVEIFLKSRSLMLLRQEEVDGRMIKPEPGELRAQYDSELQPIIDLRIIQIADKEIADKILELCRSGEKLDTATVAAGIANPKILTRDQGRPKIVSSFFKPLFADSVKAGQFQLLQGVNGVWLLIEVVAKTAGSDADFANYEADLRQKFLRDQEPGLNKRLIDSLRDKYKPVIDEEVLATIDSLKPGDPGLQDTALTIGEVKVPAWQIVRLLRDEQKMFRDRQGQPTMERDKIKEKIIANIETQTMVSIEARNRHYELKPPFKATYDFYCQHRLIKELENLVIRPQTEISDADLKAEYEKMTAQFSQPDVVEVAWVQLDDERLSHLLTSELKKGRDFFKVMEPYFPQGVEYKKTGEDKLQSEVREIVATLAQGETSPPVVKGENTFFVKLFRRFVDQHLPFSEVEEMLSLRLKEEKFVQTRNQYLATLKERSQIKVKKSRWRKLRNELLAEEKLLLEKISAENGKVK